MIKRVTLLVGLAIWLKLAVSPVIMGALVGTALGVVLEDISHHLIFGLSLVGLIVGVLWAEWNRLKRVY
ncbi:hypothetical protein [Shewanella gelidii]|uniref:Uncharacterized protein n=1 Tax=Shewanella gelidii TaxID=1642821 RepID=A0A917JQ32_9GAMM|nr:hypothetical protein [Shewanella gelidii]MCL1099529.1 hypothetical protein [Shewanella gelidii]GGI80885.1 hypothetical protein GCM10009332_17810 [Shewanella gelidii]